MISNSAFFLNGCAGHQVPDYGRSPTTFHVNAGEIRRNEIACGSGHPIDERNASGAGLKRRVSILRTQSLPRIAIDSKIGSHA